MFRINGVLLAIIPISLITLVIGMTGGGTLAVVAGILGLCYVLLRVSRGRARAAGAVPSASPLTETSHNRAVAVATKAIDPADKDALVEQMLAQRRFSLLLRPQIVSNLGERHFCNALTALEEAMALVPDGNVVLEHQNRPRSEEGHDDEVIAADRTRTIQVERFFLDRYPVTNAAYHLFVVSGGYEQMALWDRCIWPAVLDLVDRTGAPGPRFWADRCFLSGEENLPVVGVNWYEASAYARWIGKRLPTDAEWVKAGAWPVPLSTTSNVQRKYPWGDSMDRSRANLWDGGRERIVAVEEYAKGVSVGGVYQLIGNVWEWTSGSFRASDHGAGDLLLPTPMKNLRGGAYDTYFDNQATCQFHSGENPLNRRHNIGFRCAVGVCDLALAYPASRRADDRTTAPLASPVVNDCDDARDVLSRGDDRLPNDSSQTRSPEEVPTI